MTSVEIVIKIFNEGDADTKMRIAVDFGAMMCVAIRSKREALIIKSDFDRLGITDSVTHIIKILSVAQKMHIVRGGRDALPEHLMRHDDEATAWLNIMKEVFGVE